MTIIEMLTAAEEKPRTCYTCEGWATQSGQNYIMYDEIKEYVGYPQKEVAVLKLVKYHGDYKRNNLDGTQTNFTVFPISNLTFSQEDVKADWYEYAPATL